MEIECMDIYVMVTNFSGLEILLNQFFQLSLQPLSGKWNIFIFKLKRYSLQAFYYNASFVKSNLSSQNWAE